MTKTAATNGLFMTKAAATNGLFMIKAAATNGLFIIETAATNGLFMIEPPPPPLLNVLLDACHGYLQKAVNLHTICHLQGKNVA